MPDMPTRCLLRDYQFRVDFALLDARLEEGEVDVDQPVRHLAILGVLFVQNQLKNKRV
jgi:hypothetical protein